MRPSSLFPKHPFPETSRKRRLSQTSVSQQRKRPRFPQWSRAEVVRRWVPAGRRRQVQGTHHRGTDAQGCSPRQQTNLPPRAFFLSPSVLSRNVCVLANACTTFLFFFFFKESTPAPGECGTYLRPAASLPRRPSGHAFLLEEESGTREGCPLGKVNPPPRLSVGRWHAQGGGLQRLLPRECTPHPDLDSQPLHSHGHRPPRSLAQELAVNTLLARSLGSSRPRRTDGHKPRASLSSSVFFPRGVWVWCLGPGRVSVIMSWVREKRGRLSFLMAVFHSTDVKLLGNMSKSPCFLCSFSVCLD